MLLCRSLRGYIWLDFSFRSHRITFEILRILGILTNVLLLTDFLAMSLFGLELVQARDNSVDIFTNVLKSVVTIDSHFGCKLTRISIQVVSAAHLLDLQVFFPLLVSYRCLDSDHWLRKFLLSDHGTVLLLVSRYIERVILRQEVERAGMALHPYRS